MMKEAVEKAGLKAHYITQPLAYHTPDASRQGFIGLPEFPYGKIADNVIPSVRANSQIIILTMHDNYVFYIERCLKYGRKI